MEGALRSFQQAQGLPQSGNLDQQALGARRRRAGRGRVVDPGSRVVFQRLRHLDELGCVDQRNAATSPSASSLTSNGATPVPGSIAAAICSRSPDSSGTGCDAAGDRCWLGCAERAQPSDDGHGLRDLQSESGCPGDLNANCTSSPEPSALWLACLGLLATCAVQLPRRRQVAHPDRKNLPVR